jgi:hypothetical protein
MKRTNRWTNRRSATPAESFERPIRKKISMVAPVTLWTSNLGLC